jgi:F0F1-type ATP synthase assembly protein I
MALELPFFPVIGVLLGGGFGYWLDGMMHTRPIFAVLLGVVGFAAGIAGVILRVSAQDKQR